MPRRIAYLMPLVVGLVMAAALAATIYADGQRHAQQARLAVFHRLSAVQGGFENALNTRLHLARTLKTFIALNPNLDQSTFAALVGGLLADVGGIRFIELARDDAVSHVYPESGAEMVLGRRLTEEYPPEVRKAALLATRTGHTLVLPPMAVPEGGEAIVALAPVALGANGGHWGMVLVLIDVRTLFREAGLPGVSQLDIAFREQVSGGNDRMIFGQRSVFDMDPVIMNTPVPQGLWQAGALPLGGWRPSPNRAPLLYGGVALIVLTTGSLLAVMALIFGRLREREKYRYLVQNARSIILRVDINGQITFCNEHAESFYGYGPGELLGRPLVGTLIPERGPGGESMKRQLNRLLANPAEPVLAETTSVRRNGELVWVSWTYSPVSAPDGAMVELLCVGTDISDRRQTEEALRQSERQYRLLADNIMDIIWGTDADLRITFVSRSDTELRGYARSEIMGRPVREFLAGVSRHRLDEGVTMLKAMARTQDQPLAVTLDLEFLCADGGTLWLETRLGLLLNESGDIVGVIGVGRDITDRKLAEALRDDVERMARHDLKTPLGAVIGLPGEIARLGGLSEAQAGMLRTIEDAGEAMLALINRSLDLFKMERGTYALDRREVDVLEVLERFKAESRSIFREKGISMGIEVTGGLPEDGVRLMAEEELFRSMLSNLLLNALQASPEGGSVTVTLTRTDSLAIAIRNQGEVPVSIRETFFQKYVRAESSPGSGLGTYSARLVARIHGGDIALDTTTPGETCVTVTLPLR